jgi:hypothetical protein
MVTRGTSWKGTFYITNYDETAYAAYTNALIDGKARKTDPFSGSDEAAYESLYSIQFIPAFAIAVPARLLGLSTSTAFILLNIFIAVGAALALFWLIRTVSGDDLLAFAGTVFVLGFGTAAAYQGELRQLIQGSITVDYFPFLRRYEPGLPFPLFLIYLGALWKTYTARSVRRSIIFAFIAGGLIAILIFSYFFLWTTALAFLTVFATGTLMFTKEKMRVAMSSAITFAIALGALIPYFILLSGRSNEIDSVQLLSQTHQPDFASLPVLIGLISVMSVCLFVRRNYFRLSEPLVLFSLACGFTPLLILNQQVVTGRSLQPIHFEIFVANYLCLLAIVSVVAGAMGSETTIDLLGKMKKA